MNKRNLPSSCGLRHILIYANPNVEFPPKKDSKLDIALLRAANLALRRKEEGCSDVFLFILSSKKCKDVESVKNYGFPNFEVIFDEIDIETEEIDVDETTEFVSSEIERWLDVNHPGAIAYCPENEYAEIDFWWSGIEAYEDNIDWAFDVNKFADTLPYHHRAKANTWLNILAHTLEFDFENVFHREQATAFAATLCEWLQGFEAVSGNGYNNFCASSFSSSIGPSSFFLGYEASRLSDIDFEDFCNEHGYAEIDEFNKVALKLVTEDLRGKLSTVLSKFWGGDISLAWVLYSSIWSNFKISINDAILEFGDITSLMSGYPDEDEIVRTEIYQFVSEGWHDKACADF